MMKAGERDARVKDWSFCPHPPAKGSGKRGERCWRGEARARAYLHASAHTRTACPAGRRHRAEKAVPQRGGNGSTCSMVSVCKGRCNQRSLKLHNC